MMICLALMVGAFFLGEYRARVWAWLKAQFPAKPPQGGAGNG